jgi:MFS family permease
VLRTAGLLVLWSVLFQVFAGFFPTYLIDVKGLSAQVATTLFGFFALGIPMKLVAGRAYDSVGVRVPVLTIMGAAGLALAALPFAATVWSFVILTVFASSILGFETIVISDLTRRFPEGTRGTNLGALRTVYITLGSLSPVLFGAIADRGYFDEAFLGVAVLAGVVVLVVFASIDY